MTRVPSASGRPCDAMYAAISNHASHSRRRTSRRASPGEWSCLADTVGRVPSDTPSAG
jgi:hypothetical protein